MVSSMKGRLMVPRYSGDVMIGVLKGEHEAF